MENPATHGNAEKVVRKTLDEFFANQSKPSTDNSKYMYGWSLEKQITEALRKEGLLTDG